MQRREPRALTNGRANPLDEFTATLPHLDNMLPMLPQTLPGTRVTRGKRGRQSWRVNMASQPGTGVFKLNISPQGGGSPDSQSSSDEAWQRDIVKFAAQHAGSVAPPLAPGEVPLVQEVSDDGCRAAGTGQTSELAERLALGLSVDAVDSVRGCTLLMHAVLAGGGESSQLTCIELLLSQEPRANIEARSSSGDTALILASLCGHVDATDLLLRAGASKLATGASGLTALQCAGTPQQGVNDFQPGKEAVAQLLRECEV